MNRRRAIAASTVMIAGVLASGVVLAADGDLDPTFSGDGSNATSFVADGAEDLAFATAVQWDGKIVVAGSSCYPCVDPNPVQHFAVTRYNANGTLDKTFSGDGKATTSVLSNSETVAAVAVQWDGKIVVAGTTSNSTAGKADDLALARFNANGTLDKTFSGDGKVVTTISDGYETINSMALQPDGKIVVAGYTDTATNGQDFLIARYNSNGTLDSSFSSDGIDIPNTGAGSDSAYGVVIQANGKIVVAGSYDAVPAKDNFKILRYNTDGTPDSTFGGGDGIVAVGITADGERPNGVALTPDGKIVVAG